MIMQCAGKRQLAMLGMACLGVAACEGTTPRETPSAAAEPVVSTPWEEARLRGVEFRALGQEPGWTLDIDQYQSIRYTGDYGNTIVSAGAPEPVQDSAGAITFNVRTEAHELTVVIRQADCQDAMSGEAFDYTVVVRVDGRELQGCGRVLHTEELTGVYWRLTELAGSPVIGGAAGREAHLRLMPDTQVAGSTGCNTVRGPYQQRGDTLRFGSMAMTKMACADPGIMQQEQTFVRMMGEVDRFTVSADSLILFAAQQPRARFTAAYLR